MTGDRRSTWTGTPALWRALWVGAAGAAAGTWYGRPDVAVAGGALLLLLAVAAGRTGSSAATPTVRVVMPAVVVTGEALDVRVEVQADGTAAGRSGVEAVALRLPAEGRFPHGEERLVALPQGRADATRTFVASGWGEATVAQVDWLAVRAGGHQAHGPVQARPARVVVAPTPAPAGTVPVPSRPMGRRGSRRSLLAGDSADIAGVREYRPGDLLRRIDWRVSSRRAASQHPSRRTSALHVRITAAESDADVVVMVDTRLDLAPRMVDWDLDLQVDRHGRRRRDRPAVLRPATATAGGSLEATVEVAVSVAADHLAAGDRVAVVDLGRPGNGVPAGAGRRHLDRIRFRLAQVRVDKLSAWRPGTVAPAMSHLAERLPPGAVVVLVSPFYDDDAVDVALALARSGRAVLAVDTAPARIAPDPAVPRSAEALALVTLERQKRVARLSPAGVEVHRWDAQAPATSRRGPGNRAGRPAARTGSRRVRA